MKAFITGGAGFLGINLIRYLKAKGVEKLVSYDIADFDYPDKDYVVAIKGDIRKVEDMRKAMEGCDIVIHCAAALPLYSKKEIFSTDIDGSRNVMQVAMDLNIKRAIQISSTAVYGIPDHHPLYETDKLIGVGPYGVAKIEAERLVKNFVIKDSVFQLSAQNLLSDLSV